MTIRLLAIDLDGTTLQDDHHTISDANVAALQAAVRAGVQVVPSTGRALGRLPESLEAIPYRYVITSNGAKLYDTAEHTTLYENVLSYDVLTPLFHALTALPVYMEVYSEGNCYTDVSREPYIKALPLSPERLRMMAMSRIILPSLLETLQAKKQRIEKLNLPMIPEEYADKIHTLLRSANELEITSSFPGNAEINAPGCHKGAALEALCSHLSLSADEVMAMGDNGNDVTMLRYAGVAVTPANAAPCAQKVATVLPYTHTQDAVAYAVKKWIHI